MKYVMNRLKEATTWQGLIAIATGFGLTLSPEMASAIAAAGVALFGLVSVILKERGAKDAA